MNKDKIVTWVMVAALFGSAVKMVKELKEHGTNKENIDEADVIVE